MSNSTPSACRPAMNRLPTSMSALTRPRTKERDHEYDEQPAVVLGEGVVDRVAREPRHSEPGRLRADREHDGGGERPAVGAQEPEQAGEGVTEWRTRVSHD